MGVYKMVPQHRSLFRSFNFGDILQRGNFSSYEVTR